ncbi:MAG: DUF427 domain-containing protein [Ilumatobacteraceae bacterium]
MQPSRIEPGPGQESVWDYPRPPACVPADDRIRVVHRGRVVADTTAAWRVLETSQPPAFYVPRADVDTSFLVPSRGTSMCEWKGRATYWSIEVDGEITPDAAWSYESPTPRFTAIAGHLAFYAQRLDECWVGDEQVLANPGMFYGGWITSHVVGPFKGAAGTLHW